MWPLLLIGFVFLKAILSLVLNSDSLLISHGGIPYFLLLLLATALSLRNAVQNTLNGRPFWVLLASACGLWALNQWIFLYYQFVVHADVPGNSIADPILFLHVAVLLAAVATLPHRNLSRRQLYGAMLNAVLILIFWGFLYFYAVFPYQLFSNAAGYAWAFDTLYPLENWALILALGFLSARVATPWRSIYTHLLGASTLYTISSAIANLAIDSSGYVSGRLCGIGLTAAVCWFVWIPIRAHQFAGARRQASRSDDVPRQQGSTWAMLIVILISIPIVSELLHVEGAVGMHTFRIRVAIAAIVGLASAGFFKEYLAKRELVAHLASANDRLNLAMASGKALGWEWNAKTSHLSWFGDLKTSFGMDSDTYAERAPDFFRRYVHSEDQQRVSEALNEARENHKLYQDEFRLVRPDGTLRWVTAKGEFHYSSKGVPERMLGMAFDITDRKRLQMQLLENQDRMVAIVESSDDAIISKDLDGIVLSWNKAAEHLFGFSAAEVIGRSITTIIPDGLRHEEASILSRIRSGEPVDHYETVRLTKDGRKIQVSLTISPLRDGAGVIVGASKIVHDVTEQKLAEQALRKSEERFRLFMDYSPAAAWMKDEQGRYVYMSDSYLKHFGIRLEDRRGKTDFEIYPRAIAEAFRKNDEAAMAADQPIEVIEKSISPEGEPSIWLAYKFPFHDTAGQIFVGGIGIDITERRKSEETLHNLTGLLITAQEEERSRIARELHDDLSQRLALLGIGLGQLWKKLSPADVEQRTSVLEMLKSTKELSSDLHTLSHQLHSSKLEHVGLGPALMGLCKEATLKYNVDVQFCQAAEFPQIPKDVALCLFRVAQEAIANVVKHSGAQHAQVELSANATAVTLRVSDTGVGFEPAVREVRTGIGLIGMTERLRLVGGQLYVRSQVNHGTEILAEVPFVSFQDGPHLKSQVVGR